MSNFSVKTVVDPLIGLADFVADSEAPLDKDGAEHVQPPAFARALEDLKEIDYRGPGFTLNDIVRLSMRQG